MEWKLITDYSKVPKVKMLFGNSFGWIVGTLQWTNFIEIKDWHIVTEDDNLILADYYPYYMEIKLPS